MSDFDELGSEAGKRVIRRTVGDGRPRVPVVHQVRVPISIEKVLCRAAGDADFRDALLADPDGALDSVGFEMRPAERAILTSLPSAQVATMVDRIDIQRHARGRFMRGVVAAAFAAGTAATLVTGCEIMAAGGAAPDEPPVEDVVQTEDSAANTDTAVIDVDPGTASRGSRPSE